MGLDQAVAEALEPDAVGDGRVPALLENEVA
jgi:hypothetical protein